MAKGLTAGNILQKVSFAFAYASGSRKMIEGIFALV